MLHYHYFRWGFSFFYGEVKGERDFYPIDFTEGRNLSWQFENDPEGTWLPIKDPKTDKYFIPNVTSQTTTPPPTGSTQTGTYLWDVCSRPSARDPESKDHRMLVALTPYFEILEKHDKSAYLAVQGILNAEDPKDDRTSQPSSRSPSGGADSVEKKEWLVWIDGLPEAKSSEELPAETAKHEAGEKGEPSKRPRVILLSAVVGVVAFMVAAAAGLGVAAYKFKR